MNDDNNSSPILNKPEKVIQPLTDGATANNPAVDMIRHKLDALYQELSNDPKETKVDSFTPKKSKHQLFMDELNESNKSTEEIQTAWHQYYASLSENEKHEVWQEFYAEQSKQNKISANNKIIPPQQTSDTITPEAQVSTATNLKNKKSASQLKGQLFSIPHSRIKPKNPHIQSILFGLSMGSVVVIIMMFSFFNERIIAPFITPSRTVSSTPIITDLSTSAVGKEPKVIIPKINVEIPVVYDEPSIEEDAVQKALERGVLHYATTPNPGEQGNAVIFGHSSNNILNSGKYKFAFVLLSRLENNDTFMIEKDGKRYVYKVFDKKVVSPNDLSVLDNHVGKSTVTLITCDPPGTSINRLVVVGEQISPSPEQNIASSVSPKLAATPSELPSNSPSLWSRVTNWF